MTRDQFSALLQRLGPELDRLDEPWAIIGGGALTILGFSVEDLPDVDIATTAAGAYRLRRAWDGWWLNSDPDPSGRFRSRYARYRAPEGEIDVVGNLEIRLDGLWRPVRVEAVERREFAGRTWPIPTAAEQLRILRLFGRPKDLARADRLEAWAAG